MCNQLRRDYKTAFVCSSGHIPTSNMEHYDQGMVSTSDNVGMPSSVLHTLENGARTVMRENASILQR